METVKKRLPKIQKESRKTKEKKADLSNPINLLVVRVVGLEPTRLTAREPKSRVSTNSTIPAYYEVIFHLPTSYTC